MKLQDAMIGSEYEVLHIDLTKKLERRLEALGMTRHTVISVQNKKGKGILIVKIRGTRFALGENITKNIEVQEAK